MTPNLLEQVEAWTQEKDEFVTLVRIGPSQVAKSIAESHLPELGNWACAIGQNRRFSFGITPEEAWAEALTIWNDRAG